MAVPSFLPLPFTAKIIKFQTQVERLYIDSHHCNDIHFMNKLIIIIITYSRMHRSDIGIRTDSCPGCHTEAPQTEFPTNYKKLCRCIDACMCPLNASIFPPPSPTLPTRGKNCIKPWFESNSQLLCWHLSLVLHTSMSPHSYPQLKKWSIVENLCRQPMRN